MQLRLKPNTRYLTAIFTLVSILSFAQGEVTFKKANALYHQEQYEEAIKAYTSIIESGEASTALYYNLANAHYKLNAIGESIYYYEKALLLSPNDEDVQNNLAFANKATIDAIEALPKGVISRFFDSIIYAFGIEGWAWLSILTVLLFVIGYLVYYRTQQPSKKRLFFAGSMVMLLLGLVSISFAYVQYTDIQNTQNAIVFAQETVVKSEPNLRSETAFQLHEGTKIQVLEVLNDWKKIKIADGKIGWISASDIKEL